MIDANTLVQKLISEDDIVVNGESSGEGYYFLWFEASVGDIISISELGDFEVVEHVVGKDGPLDYSGGCNVWENHVVLRHGEEYFLLKGEYDSWDPQGWDEEVHKVERRQKIIDVWETI